MLLGLLVFSALGLGTWGDSPQFQHETQTKEVSKHFVDLFLGLSRLIFRGRDGTPAIVSRKEWGSRPLTCRAQLTPPVAFVITDQLRGMECQEQRVCSQKLRDLQLRSVYAKGWCDVAYNFLVGNDGRVYEGLGWNVQGLHTQGYNNISLGLAFFGTKEGSSPSPAALSAAEDLIFYAIQKGHLSPRYIQPLLLNEEVCLAHRKPVKACPNIIPRSVWEARETYCSKMDLPAKYVIIIHTAGRICNTFVDCLSDIEDMQSYHVDRLQFCDIGYHFLVGQDGNVYEGVGWHIQGAHTYGYNDIALGIAFIGNFIGSKCSLFHGNHGNNVAEHHRPYGKAWTGGWCPVCLPVPEQPPSAASLEATQTLIQCAVDKGYLIPNYLLVGHSDVSSVLSPGKALYDIISTWPHFKQ